MFLYLEIVSIPQLIHVYICQKAVWTKCLDQKKEIINNRLLYYEKLQVLIYDLFSLSFMRTLNLCSSSWVFYTRRCSDAGRNRENSDGTKSLLESRAGTDSSLDGRWNLGANLDRLPSLRPRREFLNNRFIFRINSVFLIFGIRWEFWIFANEIKIGKNRRYLICWERWFCIIIMLKSYSRKWEKRKNIQYFLYENYFLYKIIEFDESE